MSNNCQEKCPECGTMCVADHKYVREHMCAVDRCLCIWSGETAVVGAPQTRYWYECQERAFAPGIGEGWPSTIKAPHTNNARLVRREYPFPSCQGLLDNCSLLKELTGEFGGIVDAVEALPNDIRDDTCRLAHLIYQFSEKLADAVLAKVKKEK